MENELPMEAERNPEGFNFFKMQFFYLSLISLWLVFCINGCRSPNEKLFEVYEEYYPLKINKDSLFFKLEIWGISANHTRISLSTQKKTSINTPKLRIIFIQVIFPFSTK